jgi:hypothetical protein
LIIPNGAFHKGSKEINKNNIWLIVIGVILVAFLISLTIPTVRASLSTWLGQSVASESKVPDLPVTLEAITPSPSAVNTLAAELPKLQPTEPTLSSSITTTLGFPTVLSVVPADLGELSSQVGWKILTPSYLPDGYQLQSAFYDPNHKLLVLTYLTTRLLPGVTDPSLTSSETITLLQAQRDNFVPMQIAPNSNITDISINGLPATFTVGGWDTEFVKDNQAPGGGKMVSSWRNDLPVNNLYWQIGSIHLALITADRAVGQQELIDIAASDSQ